MLSFKMIGFSFLEKKTFKGFYHISAWRPPWSYDHGFYTIYVPTSHEGPALNLALIGQVVNEKKMFENNGHIHVYSPGAGANNPLASFFSKI